MAHRHVLAFLGAAVLAVGFGSSPGHAAGSGDCRYSTAGSGCRGGSAAGVYRPYEHWQDGSPAVGSTAVPPQRYSPTYMRGYNALYGFGR